MRKLWGRTNSINVQKVMWCLGELGLPFERVDAGGAFGIVDDPAYRRLNPNGLVPTFEEDGFVLWESNAIVRYLAAAHGDDGLWPADPRARALADRWMDWQAGELTPMMRDGFWQLIRTPPETRDHALVAKSVAGCARYAAMLDAHLTGRTYMEGEAFGIADIAIGCAVHRWLNLPIERAEHPALLTWYRRVAARPGAKGVLPIPIT